ncbi:unnamed protein product [Brachionus calyciflorus]|uniref:Short-chain dehydrogenase n=1 Tax=Brachionus calyciflorus TaxID=104777 RepID=A0A813U6E3_9BILA|nr:unnamed protein product [Brachionus calyciflorus]
MSSKQFNAKSTAMEVIEGHNLTGYEIIVTGASSGIGVETARALAKAGATVVLAARDMNKLKQVADDLKKTTGNNKIEIEKLELDSLESVNEFVKRYLAKNRPLNILINNAGVMGCPFSHTKDGFELQFGTNHIGHFALTLGLIPALKRGAKSNGRKSRVINLTSLGHVLSDVDLKDPNFKSRAYDPWAAYGQSKTANVLFSVALTKLYSCQGIYSNAVHPGGIATDLQRHMSHEEKHRLGIIDKDGNYIPGFKTIEQGASTSVWAAVAIELEGKGGMYLENCGYSKLQENNFDAFQTQSGHLSYAIDEKRALELWNLSLELIKNKI